MKHVVIVSWQSEMMPVPSHSAYHPEHYTPTHLPNASVREVSLPDTARSAVCCGCWEKIHQADCESKETS